jgi:hypothetical protein
MIWQALLVDGCVAPPPSQMNIGYAQEVCRLHKVEDEDHFVFECPVYKFLRTVEYPDLFVGHHSLRSFMGQTNQLRVASYIREGGSMVRCTTFSFWGPF